MTSSLWTTRRSVTNCLLAGAFALALAGALVGCASGGGYGTAAATRGAARKVDNGASELRFVTTKNSNVAKTQKFTRLDGAIAPGGAVSLVVDLSSVETQVPVRNERMQSLLFEFARFPNAEFKASVDMKQLDGLALGDSLDLDVPGKLTLHSVSKDITGALRVVRLENDRLLISTRAPVLISASEHDLTGGIEQLRVLMGLPNIIGTVPVTFSVVYLPQT